MDSWGGSWGDSWLTSWGGVPTPEVLEEPPGIFKPDGQDVTPGTFKDYIP